MSRFTDIGSNDPRLLSSNIIKSFYTAGFVEGLTFSTSAVVAQDAVYSKFIEDVKSIEIRDISLERAKDEIALYFREHDGEEIGYDELFENLHIDLRLIIQACEELEAEGKIG